MGLCLSGGGLRGVAQIGVIKALEEREIKIEAISGTSVGAVIGAFYAKGFTSSEMMEVVQSQDFFSRSSFKLSRKSLFNPKMLTNLFAKYLKDDSFDSLKIPLTVTAIDIYEGKIKYFTSGSLFDKLAASAAMPFIFPPVVIDGKPFCDGGLLNNLPIEPLKRKCNFIIAAHVNSLTAITDTSKFDGSNIRYMERLFTMGISNHVYPKIKNCDVFIEPPNLSQYSLFDKKNASFLFNLGYEYAARALDKKLK